MIEPYRTAKEEGIKLKSRLAGSVRRKLKTHCGSNKRPYPDYIMFTIPQLQSHLESQFDEHMDWTNYGSYWHIDHIIPQNLYDFADLCEVQKCWDIFNLRPLEALENLRKADKLIMEIIEEYDIVHLLPEDTE